MPEREAEILKNMLKVNKAKVIVAYLGIFSKEFRPQCRVTHPDRQTFLLTADKIH